MFLCPNNVDLNTEDSRRVERKVSRIGNERNLNEKDTTGTWRTVKILVRGEGSSTIRHAKPGDNDKRADALAAAVLFEEYIDVLALK